MFSIEVGIMRPNDAVTRRREYGGGIDVKSGGSLRITHEVNGTKLHERKRGDELATSGRPFYPWVSHARVIKVDARPL